MFNTDMDENSGIYMIKSEELQLDEEYQCKEEVQEIDVTNLIVIRNEDGTESSYLPYVENGQLVMTPISTVVMDGGGGSGGEQDAESVPITVEDDKSLMEQDEGYCVQQEALHGSNLADDKAPKFITYGGKLVRTVPIPTPEPKKNTRVPPNTYKKYLINNGNQGLIRYGRKHLLVDQQTKIGPKAFKQQLTHSADLIKSIELAPRTKMQMRHMVDTKLFAYPVHHMSATMREYYTRHCTTEKQPDTVKMEDMELLPVGYQVDIDRSQIKRITRRRRYPEAEEHRRRQELAAELLQRHQEQTVDENQIQVLLDAAQKTSSDYVNIYTSNESVGEQQIVIIHDGEETAESTACTQKNIEVLLAAAAESRGKDVMTYPQVFICDEGMEQQLLTDSNQIIIVEENENGEIIETQTNPLCIQ